MAMTRRLMVAGATAFVGAGLAGKLLAQGSPAFKPGAGSISGMGDDENDDVARLVISDPPKTLPTLNFEDDAGKVLTLDAFRGHGLLLNFWATWCMPCAEELPSLNVAAARLKARGIPVLALSSDRGGVPEVRRFFDHRGIGALPIYLDPGMAAAHAVGTRGIPTTLLVDARGRECARLEGGADWADQSMIDRIEQLIGGK